MKKLLTNKLTWIILAGALILFTIVSAIVKDARKCDILATGKIGETVYESTYNTYLTENGYTGAMAQGEVDVDIFKYTTTGLLTVENGEDGILTEGSGSVSFEFNVTEEGFYNIELGYISLPGTTSDIQRSIAIDKTIPYNDFSQIVIKRSWADDEITVKNKNELRPESYEIYADKKWFIEDYNRRYGEALKVFLSKGKHTISFETIKEPMEITSITFKAQPTLQSYETVIASLKSNYEVIDGDVKLYQAERKGDGVENILKTSQAINIQKNYSDSHVYPYHPYYAVYNTIGKSSWKNPGEAITWEVNVEKEGLYELTFKGRQSENRGVTSYRRLYINGEVPYEEMNSVGFYFSNDFNNYTIASESGEKYLFYFKEGSNTITLENVMGPLGSVVGQVEESLERLNEAYLSVIRLTGQAPSKFIDYEIAKKVPNFKVIMGEESERLYGLVDDLVNITGEKGETTVMLEKMARQAAGLSIKPEEVIEELSQLKNNISAVGTWLVDVTAMPLEIDSFYLSGANATLPKSTENGFENFGYGCVRFVSSFFIDSNSVAGEAGSKDNTLKVWVVSYGKEQAQIIKNMADDSFSDEIESNVRIELIPADVVLRAALAGNGPDVVIGLSQATAQDFAMRDACVNLCELDGYSEVASKFYASTLDSLSFDGKVYGFAEQANFPMLFYRKDILDSLGLEIPKTWDDFIKMIPTLLQNNYSAFMPNAYINNGSGNINVFQSLVYQYGGCIYEGQGSEYGYKSGLDTNAAMEAFKDYTDLYVNYGLDVQVDFSNRFRTGEIPIGIANYNTFCTLEVFAPEIKGLWSFAPLPGTALEDGTVDNRIIVDTVASVLMSSSNKKEVAWKFLKWWMSDSIQLKFATSTEAIMGTAQRYMTANPNVLSALPWSYEEVSALLSQFENSIGIPAVPGYYMTSRMISYSFSDVLSENQNPREALYLNVKTIDKELTNKREQIFK